MLRVAAEESFFFCCVGKDLLGYYVFISPLCVGGHSTSLIMVGGLHGYIGVICSLAVAQLFLVLVKGPERR